jgi:hypothetical protein
MIQVVYPGSGYFTHSRIPDPGSRGKKGPGSGFATLYLILVLCVRFFSTRIHIIWISISDPNLIRFNGPGIESGSEKAEMVFMKGKKREELLCLIKSSL